MIVAAALAAVVVLAALPLALDRVARKRQWRVGRLSQRIGTGRTVLVAGRKVRVEGWCNECSTSWRYVLPWVTLLPVRGLRPGDEPRRQAMFVLCQRCRSELGTGAVTEHYARWWLARNDEIQARGLVPDPGEWDDIKAALRVGG